MKSAFLCVTVAILIAYAAIDRTVTEAGAASSAATPSTLVAGPQIDQTRAATPIPLDEGLRVDVPAQPMPVSPDGQTVALEIVSHWRRPENQYPFTATGVGVLFSGTRLHVVDVAASRLESVLQPADAAVASWSPSWSPDGDNLAFLSDRDGMSRIWIWNRRARAVRRVSSAVVVQYTRPLGTDWTVIQWTPDSRSVVVPLLAAGARFEGARTAYRPRLEPPTEAAPEPAAVRVYGKSSDRTNGDEWHRYRPFLADLGVIDVGSGAVRVLAAKKYFARHDVSPDGARVAYRDISGVTILDLPTGSIRASEASAPETLPPTSLRWSPDSRSVVYRVTTDATTTLRRLPLAGASTILTTAMPAALPVWTRGGQLLVLAGERVIAVDSTGLERNVVTRPGLTWTGWVISRSAARPFEREDTELVWAWALRAGTTDPQLYEIDVRRGDCRPALSDDATRHDRWAFVASLTGRPAPYVDEHADQPPNAWLARADGSRTQLTRLNPVYARHVLGATRTVDWLSDDGVPLSGALLLPANYRAGVRYPTILWVYGGERGTASARDRFGLVNPTTQNMQLLATRGYAVFAPDSVMGRGTPMADIAKSLLPAASKLVELGIADPNRLGLLGHSYGMYTTLALIVQTPRFRAAVAFGGISNLLSYYGSGLTDSDETIGWTEESQGAMAGTLWEKRHDYIENSPLLYFDRVTTPLLLVHGSRDLVSAAQSDQAYLALRRLDKEVVYLRYDDVGHSFIGFVNLHDYWTRVIDWFGTHLSASRAAGDATKP